MMLPTHAETPDPHTSSANIDLAKEHNPYSNKYEWPKHELPDLAEETTDDSDDIACLDGTDEYSPCSSSDSERERVKHNWLENAAFGSEKDQEPCSDVMAWNPKTEFPQRPPAHLARGEWTVEDKSRITIPIKNQIDRDPETPFYNHIMKYRAGRLTMAVEKSDTSSTIDCNEHVVEKSDTISTIDRNEHQAEDISRGREPCQKEGCQIGKVLRELEGVTIYDDEEEIRDTYIGSVAANQDFWHVNSCREKNAEMIITVYDIAVKKDPDDCGEIEEAEERPHIFTSLRMPSSSSTDRSKLYSQVLKDISVCVAPTTDAAEALADPDTFNKVCERSFRAITGRVSMSFDSFPMGLSNEQYDALYTSRSLQANSMLSQLTQCTSLILSYENYTVLGGSHLEKFFLAHPRRSNMRLEIRMGRNWDLPTEFPASRMAKMGIYTTKFMDTYAEQLSKLREDQYDRTSFVQHYAPIRLRMLREMNKVLGRGVFVPDGPQCGDDRRWFGEHREGFYTDMWSREAWVWEGEREDDGVW